MPYDNNHSLKFPNGERISSGPNINLIFDIHDLRFAPMSTISRVHRHHADGGQLAVAGKMRYRGDKRIKWIDEVFPESSTSVQTSFAIMLSCSCRRASVHQIWFTGCHCYCERSPFYMLETARDTKQAMNGKIDCTDISNHSGGIVPTMSVRHGVKILEPGYEISLLKLDLNDAFMLIAFLHQLSAFQQLVRPAPRDPGHFENPDRRADERCNDRWLILAFVALHAIVMVACVHDDDRGARCPPFCTDAALETICAR